MTDWKTWGDLYRYIEQYIKFGDGKKTAMVSGCDNNLTRTKTFCLKNNLNYEKVKTICEQFGGYCDCEVLMNVSDDCAEESPIIGQEGMKEAGD